MSRIIGVGAGPMHDNDEAFAAPRDQMVRTQIERRGIRDAALLGAMRAVPRERFVPPELAGQAYDDRALPIGADQTISQPYMVAVMTEALHLRPGARVLEVGTGSGYQAAILSRLAGDVITIERHPGLAAEAEGRLRALGCTNVRVVVGDGSEGFPDGGPYDGIIVTAGAPSVPEPLTAQLAEGGRLVVPVGTAWHQDLVTVQRCGDRLEQQRGESCIFVPLLGRFGWAGKPDRM